MAENVTAESYTLRTENGSWLGQVVLTSDGAFMAITDWGNLNYAWRSYGASEGKSFKDFLLSIDTAYFAGKLQNGLSYLVYNKTSKQSCERFAEKILPALQEILRKEKEDVNGLIEKGIALNINEIK